MAAPCSRCGQEAAANLEGLDASLLATLKALRQRPAKERQVPAYVVFSDHALIDMAERCPRVGAAKLEEFGQVFPDAIAAHW